MTALAIFFFFFFFFGDFRKLLGCCLDLHLGTLAPDSWLPPPAPGGVAGITLLGVSFLEEESSVVSVGGMWVSLWSRGSGLGGPTALRRGAGRKAWGCVGPQTGQGCGVLDGLDVGARVCVRSICGCAELPGKGHRARAASGGELCPGCPHLGAVTAGGGCGVAAQGFGGRAFSLSLISPDVAFKPEDQGHLWDTCGEVEGTCGLRPGLASSRGKREQRRRRGTSREDSVREQMPGRPEVCQAEQRPLVPESLLKTTTHVGSSLGVTGPVTTVP